MSKRNLVIVRKNVNKTLVIDLMRYVKISGKDNFQPLVKVQCDKSQQVGNFIFSVEVMLIQVKKKGEAIYNCTYIRSR